MLHSDLWHNFDTSIMFQEIGFWASICIFFIIFIFILSEKVNRVAIVFFWAVMMVIFWQLLWFYEFHQVLHSVDFNTLLLLFGMMIIVEIFEKSWFFQYLAIKTAKKAKWNLWHLTLLLWSLTTVLSMVLDNVTTIILIAPMTIIITKLLKLNSTPILMAEVILSNIWWVWTLVWDPPNILIASETWFSFNTFLTHSLPVVIVAWAFVMLLIRIIFRNEFMAEPRNLTALMAMNESNVIKDIEIVRRASISLVFVVVMFFVHSSLNIPPSFVALMWAALLLLLVSEHYTLESILKKLDLHVLVFFTCLFVMVWWMENAWVLEEVADFIIKNGSDNLLLTAIIILWVTAILSSIVDNIPMTIAMIPIIAHLWVDWVEWVNILWWALIFWVWFWWNWTPIWSTAWVIVTAKSKKTSEPIDLKIWMKSWFTSMMVSLIVASFALIAFSEYFSK